MSKREEVAKREVGSSVVRAEKPRVVEPAHGSSSSSLSLRRRMVKPNLAELRLGAAVAAGQEEAAEGTLEGRGSSSSSRLKNEVQGLGTASTPRVAEVVEEGASQSVCTGKEPSEEEEEATRVRQTSRDRGVLDNSSTSRPATRASRSSRPSRCESASLRGPTGAAAARPARALGASRTGSRVSAAPRRGEKRRGRSGGTARGEGAARARARAKGFAQPRPRRRSGSGSKLS